MRYARLGIVLLFLVACGSGCTSTKTINPRSQRSTGELSSLLEKTGTARLVLENGRKHRITRLKMAEDVTTFVSVEGEQFEIGTPTIYAVLYERSGRGAVDGGIFGALGGSVPLLRTTVGGQGHWATGVLTTVLGATIGGIIGMVRGHTAIYRMEHSLGEPRVESFSAVPLRSGGARRSSINP